MRNPPLPWSQRALHTAIPAILSSAAWLGAQEPQLVVAIEAGFVHPVSVPVIQDGVVLIRGDRIAAIGRKGEVEIPASATVYSYPDGHAYPGLVDALSDAFADDRVRLTNADAGTPILDGLNRHMTSSGNLVTYGITTAYVSNRANSQWRGIGAVLRPRFDGYEIFPDHGEAAVQMRLTSGPARSHALTRQQALDSAGNAFQALEAYEKRFADHDKALAEYREKYTTYLDYHREKQAAEAAESEPGQGERRGGRRGRGQGRRGGRGQGRRGARGRGETGEAGRGGGQGRGGDADQETEPPAEQGAEAQEEEQEEQPAPPEKPEYPTRPVVEPDKEALLQVLKGERALRIEAQRSEEVRAALTLARDREIPRVVLEHAAASGPLAQDLALQGVPVVLVDILPGTTPETYGGGDSGVLPSTLADSGVAVAIASGSVVNARHLPIVAAYAVGKGLDPHTALRAITLTPAEILGVSREVGSLDPGKIADIVVLSASIFASDARVLRVLSAGDTQYEAR